MNNLNLFYFDTSFLYQKWLCLQKNINAVCYCHLASIISQHLGSFYASLSLSMASIRHYYVQEKEKACNDKIKHGGSQWWHFNMSSFHFLPHRHYSETCACFFAAHLSLKNAARISYFHFYHHKSRLPTFLVYFCPCHAV